MIVAIWYDPKYPEPARPLLFSDLFPAIVYAFEELKKDERELGELEINWDSAAGNFYIGDNGVDMPYLLLWTVEERKG